MLADKEEREVEVLNPLEVSCKLLRNLQTFENVTKDRETRHSFPSRPTPNPPPRPPLAHTHTHTPPPLTPKHGWR